jgi:predicted nucleic acid-binding protein
MALKERPDREHAKHAASMRTGRPNSAPLAPVMRNMRSPAAWKPGVHENCVNILAGRDLALSVQVLQEFYVQATRASRPDPITHRQAVQLIESFRRYPVQDVTSAILIAALDTHQRFQLSYWDSAIIEASRAMGCAEVLSEDLGDGQDYAGVRVINPFR